MKRRILSILLALVMALSLLPVSAVAAGPGTQQVTIKLAYSDYGYELTGSKGFTYTYSNPLNGGSGWIYTLGPVGQYVTPQEMSGYTFTGYSVMEKGKRVSKMPGDTWDLGQGNGGQLHVLLQKEANVPTSSTLQVNTVITGEQTLTNNGTPFSVTVGTGYTPDDYKTGLDTANFTYNFVRAERTSGTGLFKVSAGSSSGTTSTDSKLRQFFPAGGANVVTVYYTATRKVVKPDAPTDFGKLKELLGNEIVEVECENDKRTHSIKEKHYSLISDSYSVGTVMGDASSGYRCTVTIYAEKYVEQYNTDTDVTHVLEEEETNPKTVTLTWNNGQSKWMPDNDDDDVEFDVVCGTPEPQPPGKPTENDVGMLLASGAVKVDCTNGDVSHADKTYGLLTGSYTIGDVESDATGGYTCTITVTPDAYVELYNGDMKVNHTLESDGQTKTITLRYFDRQGDAMPWEVDSGSEVPVTFTVVCETPEPEKPATPTDEQLIKLLAGKITVDCVNTEIDPEHDNKTYGLLAGSYTIGSVEGDQETGYYCDVTIKPATYVAEYNKTLPGHTAVATTTDKTIVLEMGGTGWIVSSGAPVTFYVECVSYTLTYDANGGSGGPEKETGLPAQDGYELEKTPAPTHAPQDGVAVVFIGWTAEPDAKIYAVGDTAPKTIEKVDMDRDVTVYAAWGYDTNGDGKADVNQIPVYVYAKFENSADQQIKALPLNAPSSLELNDHGWLTLGYVLVDGTVTKDTAVAELSKTNGFFRYTDNAAFDLSLVSSLSWTLTQADGADNYVENGTTCYHLDGVIPVYQVTYDANGGANAPAAEQYLLPNTEYLLNSTTKPTHEKVNNVDVVFIGWMNSNNNEKVYVKGDAAPETIKKVDIVNQDVTVYAAWGADTNNNDIADVLETKYTVTYNDGVENKEVFEDQVYNDLLVGDDTPAFDGTPTRPGYRFVDWTPEWSETVTGDVTYTAQWRRSYHPTTPAETKPKLNKADHYAYVVGYPDGTVQPQGAITRAEVATIFFRLLSDETRDLYWTKDNAYTDVKAGDWFNNAVSTLSNAGIINGYPDGTFRPNAPITRAEMAKVIAMFAELDKDSEGFKDIAGHWAEAYIKLAAGNGWIAGYPDGTFRPNQYITRAETMTMINRVLERVPSEEEHLLSHRVMLTFPDNQPGDWYYIAVQEATNSHTYERYATEKNGDEQWIKLIDNYDWTKLEF